MFKKRSTFETLDKTFAAYFLLKDKSKGCGMEIVPIYLHHIPSKA
jgi:hypothetical protein